MKIFIENKWKYYLLFIPIIIIIVIVAYTNDYYRAMSEVKIMLHSNDKVEYKGSPWIEYPKIRQWYIAGHSLGGLWLHNLHTKTKIKLMA